MFVSSKVNPRLLDATTLVIDEFRRLDPIFDALSVMVVGAQCRDILHAGLGHDFPLRATTDLDVALVITDWDVHERLVGTLSPSGETGIRFDVAGVVVDLMPFGPVEKPRGTVTPALRAEPMDVFGFQEVFAGSIALPLPDGTRVRLPTPAGYAALKMKAWVDRSANHNDKDAPDLAAGLWWYSEAPAVQDRLYETDNGIALLERFAFDVARASSYLLGSDVHQVLGATRVRELESLWRASDLDLLATRMTGVRLGGAARSRDDWGDAINALGTGMVEALGSPGI
jgi:predicted nucleotidyltransferase